VQKLAFILFACLKHNTDAVHYCLSCVTAWSLVSGSEMKCEMKYIVSEMVYYVLLCRSRKYLVAVMSNEAKTSRPRPESEG